MNKKVALTLLASALVPASIFAADLGVAGVLSSTHAEGSRTDIGVSDLRLHLGGDVDENSKLTVVADINDQVDIREAYVSFENPFEAFGLEQIAVEGLELEIGRKKLSFGLSNERYANDLNSSARAASVQTLLGSNGLSGNGAELNYTVAGHEVEVGYFNSLDTNASTFGVVETPEAPSYATTEDTITARVAGEAKEAGLKYGVSALLYDASGEDESKITLLGVDAQYERELGSDSAVLAELEVINAAYQVSGEDVSRLGFTAYAGYQWNADWTTGVRYDSLGEGDAAASLSEIALVAEKNLSEASKLRLSYSVLNGDDVDEDADSTLAAQIVFAVK
jgi:hypothetical protein